MNRHLDVFAFDLAPVFVLFVGRQTIGQRAPVRMFRRKAHVNEVQVEGFPGGLAILGGPAAVCLFMYLECCNHVIAFLFLLFSAVFVDSPGTDGRTPDKVEAVQTKAALMRENQKRER
jgi:hypothetical protein